MRKKTIFKKISVTEGVYKRINKDKKHFEKVIGGGKWSTSDTITEYFKIIKLNKKKIK